MIESEELKNIKNLVIEIYELQKKKHKLETNIQYKCENYDTYHDEYNEVRAKLITQRLVLVKKCNEYVEYPKRKFLFLDLTTKIKFKNDGIFGLCLDIPFIDKKEYFCLINLFEHMPDYIFTWGLDKTQWMFH